MFFSIFSEQDIALILSFQFSTDTESSLNLSKFKKIDEKVVNYSRIKLPAVLFLQYLENYSKHFIEDCLR